MSDWRKTNPNNRKNSRTFKITPIFFIISATLTTQITLITKTTQITLVPLITIKSHQNP